MPRSNLNFWVWGQPYDIAQTKTISHGIGIWGIVKIINNYTVEFLQRFAERSVCTCKYILRRKGFNEPRIWIFLKASPIKKDNLINAKCIHHLTIIRHDGKPVMLKRCRVDPTAYTFIVERM